ncbi:MAG: hypothetical protein H7A24_09605 [Leptospiraceae bacterium]|nr:hypothetical protein [Leptospiraceae bacterium]MCP5512126.1 hypothetical protein [Leptospiraceae bacterium]
MNDNLGWTEKPNVHSRRTNSPWSVSYPNLLNFHTPESYFRPVEVLVIVAIPPGRQI